MQPHTMQPHTMQFCFASAWEHVADLYPERLACACDGRGVSWGEYEARAARLAGLLLAHDLPPGFRTGLYLLNNNAYLEAQFATLKTGGAPVSISCRCKSDELVQLLQTARVNVVFYQGALAMRLWEIKDRLPDVKLFVHVDDGTEALMDFAVDFEAGIRRATPAPRRVPQAPQVLHAYTDGSEGSPRLMTLREAELAPQLLALGAEALGVSIPAVPIPDAPIPAAPRPGMSGLEDLQRTDLQRPEDWQKFLQEQMSDVRAPVVAVASPLSHPGTGWLGALMPHLLGGSVITSGAAVFDAHRLWDLVEDFGVTDIVIHGDDLAGAMHDALEDAQRRGTPYAVSSVQRLISSGAPWQLASRRSLLAQQAFGVGELMLRDYLITTDGLLGLAVSGSGEVAPQGVFTLLRNTTTRGANGALGSQPVANWAAGCLQDRQVAVQADGTVRLLS